MRSKAVTRDKFDRVIELSIIERIITDALVVKVCGQEKEAFVRRVAAHESEIKARR